MPRGVPKLGSARLSSAAEELLHSPEPEVLGTITNAAISAITEGFVEPPPPWELDPKWGRDNTDARRYVDVPTNIELRWINPKLIDQIGWRDWEAVPARGDSRFKLRVKEMARPDNTIRKGGSDGPILSWMYKSWVESRQRLKAERSARQMRRAPDRMERVREEINRGSFSRYIHVDSATHPTNTSGDGRSMKD